MASKMMGSELVCTAQATKIRKTATAKAFAEWKYRAMR